MLYLCALYAHEEGKHDHSNDPWSDGVFRTTTSLPGTEQLSLKMYFGTIMTNSAWLHLLAQCDLGVITPDCSKVVPLRMVRGIVSRR